MKHRAVRWLYPYGSTRRVLRGPARGQRFVVEPGIGFSYAMGREDAAPRYFAPWVRAGMTVYDIGSNKGQMALLFASLVGDTGRVLAFEPAPKEFASLSRNLEINGLTFVRPRQAAVAESAGTLTFEYAPDHPTQGKLASVEASYRVSGTESITVETLSLDDLRDHEPLPDLIKIDVEGAAASALRGASGVLEDASPRIFIELHGPEEQAGVRDELLSRGYVAETLSGERVPDPTDGWHSPLWCFKP